ncbi:MAG: flippase-like domain-containing protein [Deltaproteobacteria bacterium]|nr:MAG: flippase-like domain-containing protein [Deltaproteobacteria bacterium]
MNAKPNHRNTSEPEHKDKSAQSILYELQEEGVKRPRLWRQMVPWLVTTAILWWIFREINFKEFLDTLSGARLSLLLPAMFGFTVVFTVFDILSFGICYRWFVVPELTMREMLNARLGCYLFQALYTPLEPLGHFAYFLRHKGAPITWTLSADLFALLNDIFVVNAVMTVTIILNTAFNFAPELESFWLFPLVFPWLIAYVHFRYWFSDSKDRYGLRFSRHPALRSSQLGKVHHYLKVYAARLAVALAGIAAHAAALMAFGIEVPFPVVIVVAPLILGGAFLPISGGGFGGPQLVALILLPYVEGNEALLAAYSMSFSACFTLSRSLIGAIFLPGYLRDLRDAVPRITTDPITGDPL